jgi:peptidoglycan glycosyltransferase
MNRELKRVTLVVFAMFMSLFVALSIIQVVQVDALAADGRDTRVLYDSYKARRGPILVQGSPIAESRPVADDYRYQRTYLNPFTYAQTTGYFSLNQGITGIESSMNSYLSGTNGSQFLEQLNSILTGRPITGASVTLTLNAKVQKAAWDALGSYQGAVIVTEADSGKILAMVSKPSYDPNLLSSHDTDTVIATYKKLLEDPASPLINRNIGGKLNPPGSTFKLVMVSAALESGKYTPASTFPNPARLRLPQTDITIQNSGGGTCGPGPTVTLADALRLSCNIPFAELGMQLGSKTILEQAEKYGFNKGFTIPMAVEPSVFPQYLDEPQTALASFGQFDDRATPLQIAMVSMAIANGGKLMYPTVVDSVTSADLKPIKSFSGQVYGQPISAQTAATITQMMVADVSNGAASNARISGVAVAGKTGTAENGANDPYTLWFTGFAPADGAHKYAITVLVENGGGMGKNGYGNLIAAPVAKKVLEAVLDK